MKWLTYAIMLTVGCGGTEDSLRTCIPSNDAYYGIEQGCEDLQICTEQRFVLSDNGKISMRGQPDITLEWSSGTESCKELWCEDMVNEVAGKVCQ